MPAPSLTPSVLGSMSCACFPKEASGWEAGTLTKGWEVLDIRLCWCCPLPCCVQRAAGLQGSAHLNLCSTARIYFFFFIFCLWWPYKTSWNTLVLAGKMFQRGPNCTCWQVLLFPVPSLLSLNPRLQGKPRRCSEGWRIGKAVEGKPCFHGKRSEMFEGSHSSQSICTWLQLRAVDLFASPALSVTCSNSCSEGSSHWNDVCWRCFP